MAEKLDARELGAVLAGLRLLQGLHEGRINTTKAEMDVAIDDIETSGGDHDPLTEDEIDTLCERLNTSDVTA